MSEIKHTFQAGKMNKDLDDRLVPQGEYRDALNIEVRTSDGGDIGTVQNVAGNIPISTILPTEGWNGEQSRFIGSIANDRDNSAFMFVASPQVTDVFDASKVDKIKLYKDMIIKYDSNADWPANALNSVVTDIFRVEVPGSDVVFYDSSGNEVTGNEQTTQVVVHRDSVLYADWDPDGAVTMKVTKPSPWTDSEWPADGTISITDGNNTDVVSYIGQPKISGDHIGLSILTPTSTERYYTGDAVSAPDSTAIPYYYIDFPYNVGKHIRPGMTGSAWQHNNTTQLTNSLQGFVQSKTPSNGSFTVVDTVFNVNAASTSVDDTVRVYLSEQMIGAVTTSDVNLSIAWVFESPRVLDFTQKDNPNITGINIIDNLLLWTDGRSEPKKINIDRCLAGTEGFNSHTKLMVNDPNSIDNLVELSDMDSGSVSHLREEHISVIRRAPRTSPKLEMSSFEGGDLVPMGANISNHIFLDANPGDSITPYISGLGGYMFAPGTKLILTNNTGDTPDKLIINAHIGHGNSYAAYQSLNGGFCSENTELGDNPTGYTSFGAPCGGNYYPNIIIDGIDANIHGQMHSWTVTVVKKKPIFELNMGRFSYRYKYQDGEYSSFAPWSELAFIPGEFDYTPKKGYNLGMVNTVRDLKITDFVVEDRTRPDDVVEVDVLYKDTVSPNVLVVKTVTRGLDPEWDESGDGGNHGVINIASEMMNQILPSLQSMRAWDNVPLKAKAQEVTGNRVVYGNYLQNFNLPVVNVVQSTSSVAHLDDSMPAKSLKSIRKYKVGVVFGDKYGRETPVTGIGGLVTSGGLVNNSSVTVEKVNAPSINKLHASLNFKDGGL
jgi:hypothetical protein